MAVFVDISFCHVLVMAIHSRFQSQMPIKIKKEAQVGQELSPQGGTTCI